MCESRTTAASHAPHPILRKRSPLHDLSSAATSPPEHPRAHTARPRHTRKDAVMNGALDLHKITRVIALPDGETENGADDRGWWPVIAFTDDVRPIVLELNVN